MPNWCSTDITLVFPDPEKAENAYKKIDSWMKGSKENGFGESWLGNIQINSGLVTVEDAKNNNFPYSCRGSVVYLEHNSEEIYITTETAWVPMVKMWDVICGMHFPDLTHILYRAEEPGSDLFYTNESEISGLYLIDSWGNFIGSMNYELTANDAKEMLVSSLKTLNLPIDLEKMSINGLIHLCDERNLFMNENFTVHQWEFVPIDDLD